MKVVNRGAVIEDDGYLDALGGVVTGSDHWETEDKMEKVEDCSVAPAKKMVYISPLVYRKIKALMGKYTSREWLAYLIGKDDSEGTLVGDIYFPKQTATGARVDDVELPASVKVIGVMHSHHSMGNSFSGTDDDYINDNHNVSILVSHREITGQYRYITPCNRYKIIPINVQVHYDIEFDEETFIKEADEKMSSPSYSYTYPTARFTPADPVNHSVGKTMPKDEDIEKALDELDFERGDTSLTDEFEGVEVVDDTEYQEFLDTCEDDVAEDSVVEDMARLGEVTVYDE